MSGVIKAAESHQAASAASSVSTAQQSHVLDRSSSARPRAATPATAVSADAKSTTEQSSEYSADNQDAENRPGSGQTSSETSRAATAQRTTQPNFTPRFSADQIRELQVLVQKALESSRAHGTQRREASFEWRQNDLGTLRFNILTGERGVAIRISADRPDVADALEGSRAVVERMIADQGLRVERFEIQIRTAGAETGTQSGLLDQQPAQTRDQSPSKGGDRGQPSRDSEPPQDEHHEPRSRWTGDREWVA